MAKHGQIRAGIGGWTFEPWRGVFYPKGCRMRASWNTPAASADHRDQRHLLPHADAGDLCQVGARRRPTASCSRSRASASSPTGACWRRPASPSSASSNSGVTGARRPARAAAVAVRADQEVRRGRLRQVPRAAAAQDRRPGAAPHGRGAPRLLLHAGVHQAGPQLLGAGRVRRARTPIRRSPTSAATSSMRACKRATTRWRPPTRPRRSTPGPGAPRLWAEGGLPDDLPLMDAETAPKIVPRDVFVYFIHEGKVRAPAAAMAFMQRVDSGQGTAVTAPPAARASPRRKR